VAHRLLDMTVYRVIPRSSGPRVEAAHGHHNMPASLPVWLVEVCVHTLAMIAESGVIAVAVYERVGLAFVRRGWVDIDRRGRERWSRLARS